MVFITIPEIKINHKTEALIDTNKKSINQNMKTSQIIVYSLKL